MGTMVSCVGNGVPPTGINVGVDEVVTEEVNGGVDVKEPEVSTSFVEEGVSTGTQEDRKTITNKVLSPLFMFFSISPVIFSVLCYLYSVYGICIIRYFDSISEGLNTLPVYILPTSQSQVIFP